MIHKRKSSILARVRSSELIKVLKESELPEPEKSEEDFEIPQYDYVPAASKLQTQKQPPTVSNEEILFRL